MHDFCAGIISGVVQTILGHPLDTLKTWSQNNIQYKNPKFNVKNLYKGVHVPILQNPFIIGSTLYVNNSMYNRYNNVYISSFCSGILSTIMYTPFDYYKINIQQQKNINIFNCYKKVHIVALHEIPANMIFFSTYKKCKSYELTNEVSGATGGVFCSIIVYPLNTIKTRMQSNIELTLLNAIKRKKLYNGISFSLCRSIMCGGIGMSIFEKLKSV
tara:strand:+ start:1454 stop:2098 length:645 start_codon:yes stop_codon:yes gene_type:complete